jgi:hypothetical protein
LGDWHAGEFFSYQGGWMLETDVFLFSFLLGQESGGPEMAAFGDLL